MRVTDATEADLPVDTDRGFKILDDEGQTLIFMHWSDNPRVEFDPLEHLKETAMYDALSVQEPSVKMLTSYTDVLTVLPDRLEQLGVSSADVRAILGEVVGRYGAGS